MTGQPGRRDDRVGLVDIPRRDTQKIPLMAFIRRHPFLPAVGIGLVGCFVVAGVVQATGLADGIATVLQSFTGLKVSNATADGVEGVVGLIAFWLTARFAYLNLRQPDFIRTFQDRSESIEAAVWAQMGANPAQRARAEAWLDDDQRRETAGAGWADQRKFVR
jgi:hypothetical protein